MPEIGQTLREARTRQRIDVLEAETATKIRSKYLRALENEEWQLLPGPAYVKSFLRTYAEYLGVDARLMVEEYKQRYERPSTGDLTPFTPARARGRPPRRPPITPGVVFVLGVVLLLGALYLLGRWGGGDDETATTPTATPTATPSPRSTRSRERDQPTRPRTVRLRLEALGVVEVCLLDAQGRRLLDKLVLQPGGRTRQFRGRRFRVTFGNGEARMRVNNRRYEVPDRPDPIGFEIRPGRRPRELSAQARPVCS